MSEPLSPPPLSRVSPAGSGRPKARLSVATAFSSVVYATTLFVTVGFAAEEDAVAVPDLVAAAYAPAVTVGQITDEKYTEISGLARSGLRPDLLWAINDSGNEPYVQALGIDGTPRGEVRIQGAENVDWEDLASFHTRDKAYLLIADIGDNEAQRESATFYIIEEPEFSGEVLPDRFRALVAWQVEFTYPDGPRNAEAAAVDADRQAILILAKDKDRAQLFDLPLFPPARGQKRTARLRTEAFGIPAPTEADIREDPKYGALRSQVTAMDIAPDRSAMTVLTYAAAYRYERRPMDDWRRALDRAPQVIALPRLNQAEALAYGGEDHSIFVTSEQLPAPLLRLAPAPVAASTASVPNGSATDTSQANSP